MATKKLTHAQKMERLDIARKFKPDEQAELMLKKGDEYIQSLRPHQRLKLAHYQKAKQIAEEVEQTGE